MPTNFSGLIIPQAVKQTAKKQNELGVLWDKGVAMGTNSFHTISDTLEMGRDIVTIMSRYVKSYQLTQLTELFQEHVIENGTTVKFFCSHFGLSSDAEEAFTTLLTNLKEQAKTVPTKIEENSTKDKTD